MHEGSNAKALGKITDSTITAGTVSSGNDITIPAAANRVAVLISCTGFSGDTDYIQVKKGTTGGTVFMNLTKGKPDVLLSLDNVGDLADGLLTLSIGSGTVGVSVTEFKIGDLASAAGAIYLPIEAISHS